MRAKDSNPPVSRIYSEIRQSKPFVRPEPELAVVLMRTGEFRTRVAGWEEPCHPGSAMHDHARVPLYPTFSHDAT